jgi:outer membrane protein TolC
LSPSARERLLGGNLVVPLINKKAIRADYLSANARQLESVYNYQRVILNAFTEVINRLSKVENYSRSIEIKKQQLESLQASVNSASKLFDNARVEYVEVLLAQRDLLDARTVMIETNKERLSAIVNAYQALGCGGTLYSTLHELAHCQAVGN